MAKQDQEDAALTPRTKYIKRLDSTNSHGWQVSIRSLFSHYVPDGQDRVAAYQKAVRVRDLVMASMTTIPGTPQSRKLASNNATGASGVTVQRRNPKGRKSYQLVIAKLMYRGRTWERSFLVGQSRSLEQAFMLACAARADFEQEVAEIMKREGALTAPGLPRAPSKPKV